MTEKQKYYALLSLVCETLPHYAVDRAIRAGYGQQYASAATRLGHVKQGKVAHLPDLVALVESSMPEFPIPAHLRPNETPQPQS
ncbi:hypothetical protein [Hymenobacter psychrotolerans]|uniref:Uncharacterized protein n=1 Tax=Hymenobacter psychrotolerans DSM 18569 TaxID=1121959 RepID=A0A1M7E5C4_9BACT|nr:hypothetical protein [Hymenobacter psychrotolerans]SHL86944.1 hypothetical protein SAMN02746009_03521 [Hymenobacter psychrotolerans DSM 18569]